MKTFVDPEIEILEMEIQDVITSSAAFVYLDDEMVGWE